MSTDWTRLAVWLRLQVRAVWYHHLTKYLFWASRWRQFPKSVQMQTEHNNCYKEAVMCCFEYECSYTQKHQKLLCEFQDALCFKPESTYQASVHQSFHSRSSCPHENLAPPWGPQRNSRSQTVGMSVHCGCPGKPWCSWPAAHHIYLFVDPWCEVHRSAGARSDVHKGLLGRAHHGHSPSHWQCLDGTVTLMRQNLGALTGTPPVLAPSPLASVVQADLLPQHLSQEGEGGRPAADRAQHVSQR